MRNEFIYRGGDVRWDLVAAMFPTTMRRGWRRSVNILARELIGLAAQDPFFNDAEGSRDSLVLAVDSEFVDRLHKLDQSARNAVERERNPFPAPAVVMRRLTPWWDTVMGRSHLEDVLDAYPYARKVYDRIFTQTDGERDAKRFYDTMLARLLTSAFEELCLTLWGDDPLDALREAELDGPDLMRELFGDDYTGDDDD